MKKLLAILPLLLLLTSSVVADFSRSQATLHPSLPGTGPFIIDIMGTWHNDCHPGEQRPVVRSFDGSTVQIDFEIIVVHITCNSIDTGYRVLVDMSEVIRTTKPTSDLLNIQVSFQESFLEQTLELDCPDNDVCTSFWGNQPRPEEGLYNNPGLLKQGLLVARQRGAMGIFPLVYDEFGKSEWVFSGTHMVEDTFFADILRPSGGDCLGCEDTGNEPELTKVGYLSVLVDRPGMLQVKIDDGMFTEYHRSVYGYRLFNVGPAGAQTFIDIEGRWGISENQGTDIPLGDLTEFFPGAFDIVLENIVTADSAVLPGGQVSYLVSTLTGGTLGQLVCKGQTALDGVTNVCEFIDPTDAAEPLFLFYQDGPSSLSIEYGRPVIDIGIEPGGMAVRLD